MTSSPIPSLQQRFEAANADLDAATGHWLDTVAADRSVHVRFMNTLAMLEHMGSHKIMVTQAGPAIPRATLQHVAEEARHALFFKHHAERLAARSLQPADSLARQPAWMYFQRLEAAVKRACPAAALYLMQSLVVEFRAVWFYRRYQQALERAGSDFTLASLLADEAGHLDDMATRLQAAGQWDRARVEALQDEEGRLYRRLFQALQAAFGARATAAA